MSKVREGEAEFRGTQERPQRNYGSPVSVFRSRDAREYQMTRRRETRRGTEKVNFGRSTENIRACRIEIDDEDVCKRDST